MKLFSDYMVNKDRVIQRSGVFSNQSFPRAIQKTRLWAHRNDDFVLLESLL